MLKRCGCNTWRRRCALQLPKKCKPTVLKHFPKFNWHRDQTCFQSPCYVTLFLPHRLLFRSDILACKKEFTHSIKNRKAEKLKNVEWPSRPWMSTRFKIVLLPINTTHTDNHLVPSEPAYEFTVWKGLCPLPGALSGSDAYKVSRCLVSCLTFLGKG